MQIKERILKSEKMDWRKLNWLQSENLKDPRNIQELVESIQNNGIIRGFRVWQDETGKVWIIDGHHMEKALRIIEKKGAYKLPDKITCHFIECEDRAEAGKMVLLNIATYAKVTALGLDEHIKDFDLSFEGLKDEMSIDAFDFADLKKEMRREETSTANNDAGSGDDDFGGEPPAEPISKIGDRYEIESGDLKHVIQCADSTDETVVVALWKDKPLPVAMITDPPYGVEYDPNWRNERDGGNRKRVGKVQNDSIPSWADAYKHFPGNVLWMWHAALMSEHSIADVKTINFKIVSQVIWVKSHMVLGRGDLYWKHEPCWYAVRNGKTHNFKGDRTNTTVWEIQGLTGKDRNDEQDTINLTHGTQKPVECMARPMRLNSLAYDAIYDPFLGSGTTLIAGEMQKRHVYGNDIDPAYIDMIVARYVKYKSDKAEKFVMKKNGKRLTKKQMHEYVDLIQP